MFKTERIVEFGMCDISGILFFARIFDLAHSSYEEFIISSDLENNYFENDSFAIPLLNATADYNSPISLHEVLEIEIKISEIGTTSFQLTTTFIGDSQKPKATVTTTHIFVNKRSFKKTNIPDEFLIFLKENKS